LVKNRESFENKAINSKITLGDWFCSPLYPVKQNLSLWDLNDRDIPVALQLSKQIVNLPTDTNAPGKVIGFLEDNIQYII